MSIFLINTPKQGKIKEPVFDGIRSIFGCIIVFLFKVITQISDSLCKLTLKVVILISR